MEVKPKMNKEVIEYIIKKGTLLQKCLLHFNDTTRKMYLQKRELTDQQDAEMLKDVASAKPKTAGQRAFMEAQQVKNLLTYSIAQLAGVAIEVENGYLRIEGLLNIADFAEGMELAANVALAHLTAGSRAAAAKRVANSQTESGCKIEIDADGFLDIRTDATDGNGSTLQKLTNEMLQAETDSLLRFSSLRAVHCDFLESGNNSIMETFSNRIEEITKYIETLPPPTKFAAADQARANGMYRLENIFKENIIVPKLQTEVVSEKYYNTFKPLLPTSKVGKWKMI